MGLHVHNQDGLLARIAGIHSIRETQTMACESDGPLSGRVVSGGIWVLSLRAVHQLLNLAKIVFVASLLDPYEYGLMGIALLIVLALDALSQTGFQQALIHKKEDVHEFLDPVWTMLMIRGFLLFGVMFVAAPYLATFFKMPEATDLIRVTSVLFVLRSMANIGVLYFQKEMQFRKQFTYLTIGSLADIAVAVPIGLATHSVWALVLGLVVGAAAMLVASYALHPYRPRVDTRFKKTRGLVQYGKWILVTSIIMLIILQGDSMVVSYVLGATALGLYQMAYYLSNTPATEIANVISQVTFPAYSKLQDVKARMRDGYIKVLTVTSNLSILLGVMIIVLAPEFTTIFLGTEWLSAVPVMRILALAGTIRAIAATTGPLFLGMGRPGLDTRIQSIRLATTVVLVVPLTTWYGIEGAAVAVLAAISVSSVGFSYYAIKLTGCSLSAYGKTIAYPVAAGGAVTVSLFALKYVVPLNPVLTFLSLGGLGVLLYAGFSLFLDKYAGYGFFTLIRDAKNSFLRKGETR